MTCLCKKHLSKLILAGIGGAAQPLLVVRSLSVVEGPATGNGAGKGPAEPRKARNTSIPEGAVYK